MARILTITATIFAAGAFAWAVPLVRLFDAFQPLMIALSIMVAAVLIRLNRGMPTLEWENIAPKERKDLTSAIVKLAAEYGWIAGIVVVTLAGIVALSVVGKAEITTWQLSIQRTVSGALGATLALCMARMSYVVWRDIDIVRLQKEVIDGFAEQEDSQEQVTIANNKVMEFKSANVRRVPVDKPKAWGE